MRPSLRIISLLLITLLIQVNANLFAQSSIQASTVTEKFQELVLPVYESLSEKRKQEIAVLKNNLFKFFLEATYKSDEEKIELFKRAYMYLEIDGKKVLLNIANEVAKGPESNTYELISPPRWNLAEEVKYLSKTVEWKNSTHFGDLFSTTFNFLIQYLNADQLEGLSFLEHVVDKDDVSFLKDLRKYKEGAKSALTIVDKFEEKISAHFDMLKHIGSLLENSGKIALADKDIQKFLIKFFNFYYSNVSNSTIKNIINDLMMLGHKPLENEIIEIMFKNSGPGLGKIIQQLGKESGIDNSLSKLMAVMENLGKPVPHYLIEETVARDTGGFTIVDIDQRPLGTGTMAQVNRANLIIDGQKKTIALRFLKPGIEDSTIQDIQILNDFTDKLIADSDINAELIPTVKKLIKSVEGFLHQELDLSHTINMQRKGKLIYEQTSFVEVKGIKYQVSIKVPDVYLPKQGRKTKLHIQEFINFGYKFSNMKDKRQQEAVAETIEAVWFKEALLKSGFFHNDLHQGNFTVKTIPGTSTIEIVFFDFGLTNLIDKKVRRAFILIGAGTAFKDPKLIAKGLVALNPKGSSNFKTVLKEIKTNIEIIKSPQEWIVWALKKGHLQSEELGSLARGASLVTQLEQLIGIPDIASRSIKDQVLKSGLKKFFSINSSELPLSRMDLLKIGVPNSRQICIELLSKFLK